MNIAKLFVSLLLLAPLAACASTSSSTTPGNTDNELMASNDGRFSASPQEDVIAACGLDTTRTYFAYDSANLANDDRQLLSDVSTCMTTGRLVGRSVIVIGYTDRSGTADYNLELGMVRGESVAKELIAHGVQADRLVVRSRGEGWAIGTTPDGRVYDRKVELRLLKDVK